MQPRTLDGAESMDDVLYAQLPDLKSRLALMASTVRDGSFSGAFSSLSCPSCLPKRLFLGKRIDLWREGCERVSARDPRASPQEVRNSSLAPQHRSLRTSEANGSALLAEQGANRDDLFAESGTPAGPFTRKSRLGKQEGQEREERVAAVSNDPDW